MEVAQVMAGQLIHLRVLAPEEVKAPTLRGLLVRQVKEIAEVGVPAE
jgi:hypothetical protein